MKMLTATVAVMPRSQIPQIIMLQKTQNHTLPITAKSEKYATKLTLSQKWVEEFDEIVCPDFDRLFILDKPILEEHDYLDDAVDHLKKNLVEMNDKKKEMENFILLIDNCYLGIESEFKGAKEEAEKEIENWVNSDIEEELVFENEWFEVEGEDMRLTDAGYARINNAQYQLHLLPCAEECGWSEPSDLCIIDHSKAIDEAKDHLDGDRIDMACDRLESMNSQIKKFSEFIVQLTS
ncbi:hypothetical protein OAK83_01635 [bacterium]|nr:hypothetical protein [bacterium]